MEQQGIGEQTSSHHDHEFLPFTEAMKYLSRLCLEHRSGSMYIYTMQLDGAKVLLSQGKIVDIKFKTFRGRDALPHMRKIEMAKYFFKSEPQLRESKYGLKSTLPSNDVLFMELGMKFGAITANLFNTAGNKKILVVEDSAMARKVVVKALTDKGYDVIEAEDGEEALAKVGRMKPDMVLLDLILPKMDGYEVLHNIKKDRSTKDIPIIVLTSRDALFDKLKGKMSGTDEYLTKPVQTEELFKKLEKYLGK